MRVLVVGAGIAGLTVARLLSDQGHDVTVFERAQHPRSAGYMIDFFGPGFDVAERLGLLEQLEAIHYPIAHLLFTDRTGRVQCDMDYPDLSARVFNGRHFNFTRGELEHVLRDWLGAQAEIRWATEVANVSLTEDGVFVESSTGRQAEYDLLIGADGVRSSIREHLLAEQSRIVRLEAHTAAFVLSTGLPGIDTSRFVSMVADGRTAAVYPIRGGRTATFFVHAAKRAIADRSRRACLRELDREYSDAGDLARTVLSHSSGAEEVFFDDVIQVEAARWSRGRAVLLGDSCGCVSLLGGQGASMAMAGAYVLAQELSRNADVVAALHHYEKRLRPAVQSRQKTGRRNRTWFLPPSERRARLQLKATHYALKSPLVPLMARTVGGGSIPLDP